MRLVQEPQVRAQLGVRARGRAVAAAAERAQLGLEEDRARRFGWFGHSFVVPSARGPPDGRRNSIAPSATRARPEAALGRASRRTAEATVGLLPRGGSETRPPCAPPRHLSTDLEDRALGRAAVAGGRAARGGLGAGDRAVVVVVVVRVVEVLVRERLGPKARRAGGGRLSLVVVVVVKRGTDYS